MEDLHRAIILVQLAVYRRSLSTGYLGKRGPASADQKRWLGYRDPNWSASRIVLQDGLEHEDHYRSRHHLETNMMDLALKAPPNSSPLVALEAMDAHTAVMQACGRNTNIRHNKKAASTRKITPSEPITLEMAQSIRD